MSHKPRRFIRRSGVQEESQTSLESASTEASSSTEKEVVVNELNDQSNPQPVIDDHPTSPINHHDNDSGGSVQLVTSPKKKRRFFKNVQSQDSSSMMNTSFTSDSMENSQLMDAVADSADSPNVKEPVHEAPVVVPTVCETVVNIVEEEETKEQQPAEIEEPIIDTIINEKVAENIEEIKQEINEEKEIIEEEVKRPAKKGRKRGKKGATVLMVDSTNCVMIGEKKFPVKKLSKKFIVNLTDNISELEDMDDLPVEISNLMEDYPEFFSEDRHKIKQACFLTCSIKALTTKKEEIIIDFMFTQTLRELGIISFSCHYCKSKQGCRMICDNSNICNKREFYSKHNITKPDPLFGFVQNLPCMTITCKDCYEQKGYGDFNHYLYNGDWICTHCRCLCDNPKCTRKSGLPSDFNFKYNGKNALEQFIAMVSDKSEMKKVKVKKEVKKEETTKQEPVRKRGRPSLKKDISESEEEEEISSESEESEEEVKITKRVTRSSKLTPSPKPQSSSSSSKSRSNKKVKKEDKTPTKNKTPEKETPSSKEEEEEIIPLPPKQPSISPLVKREMAQNNVKEMAKFFIGSFNYLLTPAQAVSTSTSNVNSSI